MLFKIGGSAAEYGNELDARCFCKEARWKRCGVGVVDMHGGGDLMEIGNEFCVGGGGGEDAFRGKGCPVCGVE